MGKKQRRAIGIARHERRAAAEGLTAVLPVPTSRGSRNAHGVAAPRLRSNGSRCGPESSRAAADDSPASARFAPPRMRQWGSSLSSIPGSAGVGSPRRHGMSPRVPGPWGGPAKSWVPMLGSRAAARNAIRQVWPVSTGKPRELRTNVELEKRHQGPPWAKWSPHSPAHGCQMTSLSGTFAHSRLCVPRAG